MGATAATRVAVSSPARYQTMKLRRVRERPGVGRASGSSAWLAMAEI